MRNTLEKIIKSKIKLLEIILDNNKNIIIDLKEIKEIDKNILIIKDFQNNLIFIDINKIAYIKVFE